MSKKIIFIMIQFNSFVLLGQIDIPAIELKFTSQIQQELREGSNVQQAAFDYTFIGEYDKASKTYDAPIYFGFDTMSVSDKSYFKNFQTLPALDYILKRAEQEQIIIINEAHHTPIHRVFVKKLLKQLKNIGYRYLALEALQYNHFNPRSEYFLFDTLLHQRGYPTNTMLTGTYTSEPQMGNLIREALGLEYQLVAYDKLGKEREKNGASNIKAILDLDPDAKVIVLCGYHHLIEEPVLKEDGKNKKWMAYYLKDMTGINPFTINQTVLTARTSISNSPYYDLIDAQNPSVLIDIEQNKIWNGRKGFNFWDLTIYHPNISLEKDNFSWIYEESSKLISLENKKHHFDNFVFPVLIMAFRKGENTALSVPVSIRELESKKDKAELILPRGKYNIVIKAYDGNLKNIKLKVK